VRPVLPARSRQVVDRRIAGETFLVPVRGKLADLKGIFALNPTAAFVWERLDGRTGPGDIARALSEGFDVDAATALADTEELLHQFREQGFLEEAV
jgi:hypothetical protein